MRLELDNIVYERRMELYAGQPAPECVQVTHEVNCYLVWDSSLWQRHKGIVGMFSRFERDEAIDYAVAYAQKRLQQMKEQAEAARVLEQAESELEAEPPEYWKHEPTNEKPE
jgi:hypothetical protein